MATVVASMSMSLDGFIAGPEHQIDQVFSWHQSGDVAIPVRIGNRDYTFNVGPTDAAYLRAQWAEVGAILCGRGLFDLTQGWGGNHPVGQPIVCYSRGIPEGWEDREGATFVDTLEGAVKVAREIAGDGRMVGVSGTRITAALLNAGLLDEIEIEVVPVLIGEGRRFFDGLKTTPIALGLPKVVEGEGVTHLRYKVRK